MTRLSESRYCTALAAEATAFAELFAAADLTATVPTCPEWTMLGLAEHVGQVHRFAGTIVTTRATEPPGRSTLPDMDAPDEPVALAAWLQAGGAHLAAAVRDAGLATPVWSWADDQSVGFWARRMLHETAVHRADGVLTLGRTFELDADVAADGVSEWLGLLSMPGFEKRRPMVRALRGDGQTLHLHATDDGLGEAGEWIVERTPSGIAWEHGHRKCDVAVRGAAVDLLLAVLGRTPPGDQRVEVLGDTRLFEHWLANARF